MEQIQIEDGTRITITKVTEGFQIGFEGALSFEGAIAMLNSGIYQVIGVMKEQLAESSLEEEELEAYKMFMYDDLNDRFAALLDEITPAGVREQMQIEAFEDAEREAMEIEKQYKVVQYDKIIEAARGTNNKYLKVKIQENGELQF